LSALFLFSCSNKKEVSKVTLAFAGFKSPTTSFDLDFDAGTLRLNDFGYDAVLDFPSQKLIPEFSQIYSVPRKKLQSLKKLFNLHRPDSTIKLLNNDDFDGSGFTVYYIRPNIDTTKLLVVRPSRGKYYHDAYVQVDSFFNIVYQVIHDSLGIATVDKHYQLYYPLFPVRKLSDSPPVYKIWGEVTGSAEDQPDLKKFLESIKNEKCVIVEIAPKALSYAITSVFAEYALQRNIHFVSTDLERCWDILQEQKQEMADLATLKQRLKEDPDYLSRFEFYLSHGRVYNEWLSIPKEELFKQKAAILRDADQNNSIVK